MASSNVPQFWRMGPYDERSWSTEALYDWDRWAEDTDASSTSTQDAQAQITFPPVIPIYHPYPSPTPQILMIPPASAVSSTSPSPPSPPALAIRRPRPPASTSSKSKEEQKLNSIQRMVQWVQKRGRFGSRAENSRALDYAPDRLGAFIGSIEEEPGGYIRDTARP